MIAYKGFARDLTCRGYKFKEGMNVTEEANCRQNGFHCAEDPLDCLSYYPRWDSSVYYIVKAEGDINEDGNDSKISCTEMTLLNELTLGQFVMESLIYISNHSLRKQNHLVRDEKGEANDKFIIVRGKNPHAKGKLGTFLGFAKENSECPEIDEIAVYEVDGKEILPDTWYTIEGVSYKMEDQKNE